MSTELLTIVQDSGLSPTSAAKLLEAFQGDYNSLRGLAESSAGIVVTEVSQTDMMATARKTRLAIKDIRVSAEKRRKALKEESLRTGQSIDKVAKVITAMAEAEESRLLEQELFAERAEGKRRIEVLNARCDEVISLGVQPGLYHLGDMTGDQFQELIVGIKAQQAAAQIAQMQAEEEAAAKAEEEALIRAENNRLRQEAAQKESEARHERERMEEIACAEREAQEHKEWAYREEQAEIARQERAKAAEALRVEREARERLEAEKAAIEAAEAQKRQDEEAAKLKAAQAPDRSKLLNLGNLVGELPMPTCSTEAGKQAVLEIDEKIGGLMKFIEDKADGL